MKFQQVQAQRPTEGNRIKEQSWRGPSVRARPLGQCYLEAQWCVLRVGTNVVVDCQQGSICRFGRPRGMPLPGSELAAALEAPQATL